MSIKKKYVICIVFIFFMSFNSVYSADKNSLAHKVSADAVKILTKKYPLELAGFGGGAIYGINILSLSFNVKKNVTIEEARKLVLDSAEVFLNEINSDLEIRPYLSEYPYPISRIELRFFVNPPSPFIGKSDLSVFSLYHIDRRKETIITYKVDESEFRLKEVFRETYEEAVERAKIE